MAATTRWKDTQAENFTEVLEKMTSTIQDDERTNSVYRINFRSNKVFENDCFIELNGVQTRYNIVKYGYDQVTAHNNPEEDRPLRKNGHIVVLEDHGAVYYIVDQNSGAKRLLRKMLGYAGKNEIEDANFDFVEDFFVWLVNKVYNSEGEVENTSGSENKSLLLEEIKGIRGNTEDLQTKVATSGESVMNVISTLSFLLESRRLNQVILNLKYTKHDNIRVKLQKSTIELERPYVGEFDTDSSEEMMAKLYLLLYVEILPMLEQEYRMNKDEDVWNQAAYINFLSGIKDTVIEKIESKIQTIN